MPYSSRAAYDGVAEFSIYVAGAHQGRGAGRLVLKALLAEAERSGLHKVTSRIFTDNAASRGLCASLGFREVGVHLRHGLLDGRWRDVVTVEILLGAAAPADPTSHPPLGAPNGLLALSVAFNAKNPFEHLKTSRPPGEWPTEV